MARPIPPVTGLVIATGPRVNIAQIYRITRVYFDL
jgi:hypothetical protein